MAQTTMYKGINNSPVTTLTAQAAATDTEINVASTAGFPAAPNIATLGVDDNAELVLYTGIGTGKLTGCTRGFNGTTARSWAVNTKAYRGFTAYDHDTFVDNISDLNTAKAAKAATPTNGNLAALDADGNVTDSGKKPADFATSQQGSKADSSIQSVKVAGTALTPDTDKAVDIPANEANGLLKLDGNGKAPVAQLPDYMTGAPNHTYDGVNLKTVFANAAALHTAVAAGDFSKIRIGDFWPVTLNGNFYDFSSYTAPSGTEYFSDTALSTSAGTLSAAKEITYVNETYCTFKTGDVSYYVATSACLTYFEKTLTNAAMKFEVCPQVYIRYGDTSAPNHLLMVPRDCLPLYLKMRKTNTDWTDTEATNPWLGSALHKTLNDPDHGIIALLAATDIGAYIYAGPNGKGMRFLGETKAAGASNATSWGWLDRGKLFLPLECEVWGVTVWQERTYGAGAAVQWPIFTGSLKHISKGVGDGASRDGWWCASSSAGSAAYFAYVSNSGNPGNIGRSFALGVPPCFTFA